MRGYATPREQPAPATARPSCWRLAALSRWYPKCVHKVQATRDREGGVHYKSASRRTAGDVRRRRRRRTLARAVWDTARGLGYRVPRPMARMLRPHSD